MPEYHHLIWYSFPRHSWTEQTILILFFFSTFFFSTVFQRLSSDVLLHIVYLFGEPPEVIGNGISISYFWVGRPDVMQQTPVRCNTNKMQQTPVSPSEPGVGGPFIVMRSRLWSSATEVRIVPLSVVLCCWSHCQAASLQCPRHLLKYTSGTCTTHWETLNILCIYYRCCI